MAVTKGPRLGLTRWGAGTDPFRRTQIDADNAALEAQAVLYKHGVFNDRPAAGVEGRFYWSTDTGALSYDDGQAWTEGIVLSNDPRMSDARVPKAHQHAAGDVTSGVFAAARLGTGAATSATILYGDGVWRAQGAASLASLTDVSISEAATGHFLRFNGSTGKWENKPLVVADMPVAASKETSSTKLVRADDARLSDARTPKSHGHDASDVQSGVFALARIPVADNGEVSATEVVRADDGRLSNARPPTAHQHPTSDVTGLDTALAGKAPKVDATLTGTVTVGASDDDVLELRALEVETHTRSTTITTDPATGLVTQVVEKAAGATVRTVDLAYTDGVLTTVTETAGEHTATTTLTYDGAGTLTGTTRSVA